MEYTEGRFKLRISDEATPTIRAKLDIKQRRYPTAIDAYKDIPVVAGLYNMKAEHLDVDVHR